LPLDSFAELGAFFDRFMIAASSPAMKVPSRV
jgi:hypothetical protein